MKYYLYYEYYSDYNQFEGSWDSEIDTHTELEECIKAKKLCLKNSNFRKVIGPLIEIEIENIKSL